MAFILSNISYPMTLIQNTPFDTVESSSVL
jgi:hypothetical protein